eukprot:416462_1
MFTEDGFPIPIQESRYKVDDLVFALVDTDMPYWPAQIKMCKCMNEITLITFNDPSLSILTNEQIEYNTLNGITKPRRRFKKKLQKERTVSYSKLLPWNALMKNGNQIQFKNVIEEFVKRKNYKNVEDIPDQIYEQWNRFALADAEEEEKRLHDLNELQQKKKQEKDELERARQQEIKKANEMSGQIWDGRKKNRKTGELEGYILHAGDMIRYWTINQMNNQNELVKTKIIQLYD